MSTYSVNSLNSILIDSNDPTKKLKFDLSNVTPSSTKTIYIPNSSNSNLTLVGESTNQTISNKTIDINSNTIYNVSNSNIKVGAAIDASKIANGSVSNTKFQYLSDLTSSAVGDSDTQTLSNKTLIDSSTTIQNNSNPTKQATFDLSNLSATRSYSFPDQSTTLVGQDTPDTLINKVIDADLNTIYGLSSADVGLPNTQDIKHNLSASINPTSSEDINLGYSNGSIWINSSKIYICTDPTTGSAIWTDITAASNSTNTNRIIFQPREENTKNETYEKVGQTIFPGGTSCNISAVSYMDSDADSYSIRIYDDTNNTIVAEQSFSNTEEQIVNLGSGSNVPASEAVFEIHMKKDSGKNKAKIHIESIEITYD